MYIQLPKICDIDWLLISFSFCKLCNNSWHKRSNLRNDFANIYFCPKFMHSFLQLITLSRVDLMLIFWNEFARKNVNFKHLLFQLPFVQFEKSKKIITNALKHYSYAQNICFVLTTFIFYAKGQNKVWLFFVYNLVRFCVTELTKWNKWHSSDIYVLVKILVYFM